MKNFITSLKGKLAAGLVGVGLVGGGTFLTSGPSTVGAGEIGRLAETAPEKEVKVKMTVAGGYCLWNGKVLLNDSKDYTKSTLTAVVPGDLVEGEVASKSFKGLNGKTLTLVGKPTKYEGKPQLIVTRILEK